jgi:hypothetical protein
MLIIKVVMAKFLFLLTSCNEGTIVELKLIMNAWVKV